MTVEDLRRKFSQGNLTASSGPAVTPSSSSTMKVRTVEDVREIFCAATPPSSATTTPRPIGTGSNPSTPTASETDNTLSVSELKVGNFYTVRLIFPSALKKRSSPTPAHYRPDSIQKSTTEKDMVPTAHPAKSRIGLVVDKDDDTVTILVKSPGAVEHRRLFASDLGIELKDDQKPATEPMRRGDLGSRR